MYVKYELNKKVLIVVYLLIDEKSEFNYYVCRERMF